MQDDELETGANGWRSSQNPFVEARDLEIYEECFKRSMEIDNRLNIHCDSHAHKLRLMTRKDREQLVQETAQLLMSSFRLNSRVRFRASYNPPDNVLPLKPTTSPLSELRIRSQDTLQRENTSWGIDNSDVPRRLSRGRAYVYVFPCVHEDLLKLGFTREPLHRLQTFHQRYFEFFDIERAFMVEVDSVADARRLETHLGSTLELHRAPAPLVIPLAAAGHTEWYRGAYSTLVESAERLHSTEGYRLHAPLRIWLAAQLQQRRDLLFEWTQGMLEAIRAAQAIEVDAAMALERTLGDTLDAYVSLGLRPESDVPGAVREWYRLYCHKK